MQGSRTYGIKTKELTLISASEVNKRIDGTEKENVFKENND
jgi:hypothetical protein